MCKWCNRKNLIGKEIFECAKDFDEGKVCGEFDNPKHLKQPEYYIEGGDGPIDKELIPLLDELNKVGLKTTQSCSGHGKDVAYISISDENIDTIVYNKKENRFVIYWNLKENKKVK